MPLMAVAGAMPVRKHLGPEIVPGRLTASAVPDWSRRIPALDGLRGVAIGMVLLCHSVFSLRAKSFLLALPKTNSMLLSPLLKAGTLTWSGVDLFFVLSGFLIGGILLDAKHSPR